MSGTLTLALRTAQSGLLVNQQALNSVANNISNVNTPSYSRKIVNIEQRVVAGNGAGVQLSEITRAVDEGLMKSLRLQNSTYQSLKSQGSYYGRLQDLLGTPADNTSLGHVLGDLAASIETLAVTPNQVLEQSDMVRQAQEIALKFQDMSQTLQDLRVQTDGEIASNIDTINTLTTKIADLNDKIIRNKTVSTDVSDLRDQRDQALDQLSALIDVRYFQRSDGDIVVFTSGGRTLVDNVAFTLSHAPASSMTPTTAEASGGIGGIYIGEKTSGNNITGEIAGGELKGLISMRDQVLPDLQSQMDELASRLKDMFNQVHNRGVPFPGLQSMTGSRTFLDTSDAANTQSQTIQLGGTDDVAITLFDADGNQTVTTTLNTIMTTATFSSRGSLNDWTIPDMASTLQTWLQSNGASTAAVGLDSSNHLSIELNSSDLHLAFRDQTASAPGSAATDAEIRFNADGDTLGTTDETVYGFSNFFGLNDFFTDGLQRNLHESNVMSPGFTGSGTLMFFDGTADLPLDVASPGAGVSVTIPAGSSLAAIAAAINEQAPNITASVIPDGAGYRLRIGHDDGQNFEVVQTAGTLLDTLGMHVGNTGASTSLDVRIDIVNSPSLVSSGTMQWDSELGVAGEYLTSLGDGTTIDSLATLFNTVVSFDSAGGLGNIQTTFSQYGAAVVGNNASLADTNKNRTTIEATLKDSLQYKSDSFRGVNLDEEMSNLIVFEQAYSASARVISVIQSMFDALERSVG